MSFSLAQIRRMLDSLSGSMVVVDNAHRKVHDGHTFDVSYRSPDLSPVADNGNLDMLFVTGARYAHFTFECHAGGDAEISMYEGTAVSNNGTSVKSQSLNRNGLLTPSLVAFHTPTITTLGEQIFNMFMSGGTGVFSGGAGIQRNVERILKANTIYLVRLTNRAGSAQPLCTVAQWYE